MVKKILIPTDFSACATDAAKAGLALARKINASVYLYTHLALPGEWASLPPVVREHFSSRQRETEAEHQQIIAANPDLPVFSQVGGSRFLADLEGAVSRLGIDLIVMGSHGISGKSEYFIGSKTQKVVRKVHCPVLVIKNPLPELRFDRVVFASNFNLQDKESFRFALDLLRPFEPTLHLVNIDLPDLYDSPALLVRQAMEDFARLAAPLACEFHVSKDWSIDAGVRLVAEELKADLVVISNRHRPPMYRLLKGNTVEALVNHAELPVLSVDAKSGR